MSVVLAIYQILQAVATNAPNLITNVRSIIDALHQNGEMSDADKEAMLAVLSDKQANDPAWKPSQAYIDSHPPAPPQIGS